MGKAKELMSSLSIISAMQCNQPCSEFQDAVSHETRLLFPAVLYREERGTFCLALIGTHEQHEDWLIN